MFTALVLACLNVEQPASALTCQVFKSEIEFSTYDQCIEALGWGIAASEQQGWYVRDYACFDWKTKDLGDAS